jgi:hypothetical protein
VELSQCPYDGADIEAAMVSGGSILLVCPHCGGEWEQHGSWTRPVTIPAAASDPSV